MPKNGKVGVLSYLGIMHILLIQNGKHLTKSKGIEKINERIKKMTI